MSGRLDSLEELPEAVARPSYDRSRLEPGIAHIGPGAFFRAHTAFFTDAAIAASGGDWGIETAGLRSPETAAVLNAQNGLYTLLVRKAQATHARVVGAIVAAHAPAALLARLADPAIRIVTLTVTEKAYGFDPASRGLDQNHPDIVADLAAPHTPRGVVGHLVEALARRRDAGAAPFTPLSCDNLPANGALLKRLVLEFAERRDPVLSRWIERNVPFPSAMVDRITPASTEATYRDAARLTGRQDLAAVEAEPFAQWVIEDTFATGRPAWENAGALMVGDVSPYEKMKLRMLNGTHSLVAYLGFIAGHEFIRDAMADPKIATAARAHIECASATLECVPGVDLDRYGDDLMARFTNRAIAHRTHQVAMDGTQKLPQRIFEPAAEMLVRGAGWESFALATAAWMRYALGIGRNGVPYELRDPRQGEIAARLASAPRNGEAIASALLALPGFFPEVLRTHPGWRRAVAARLEVMLRPDT